ncbi:murein transglycosylase [Xenorhabdus hominickii]|uniref:peptidoglycan lytic exotransglycosylase n=1 Tax=Xenorhabdus hominickii TaxID=351679 RepID=A0A2G0QD08_XENHO|nr:murein transglycosylase [Xenorhabdus hominickii]AOM41215.1 murein transglycosylase [Xenorhabdus hominickii]PHM55535.1 putative transglycosylase signal peptide protein [Xenorhabdus hominickii]PHM57100.1 putative transglycosylase signal peptide protein [Xenorhabdus hominickii]
MSKWQHFAIAVSLVFVVVGAAHADSLDAQRQRYQEIKQAWDAKNREEIARLMPTLQKYPLYPYLEYRQLTQDLAIVTPEQVQHFIDNYPTLPLTHSLKLQFINVLAKNGDWHNLLTFSPNPPNSVAERCHYYFAQWATGHQQVAWQGAEKIWLSGSSLPDSCNQLINVWEQSGYLSANLILQRLELAMKENNVPLVSYLAKRLPLNYQKLVSSLVKLQHDPELVEQFATTTAPTDFTRSVVITAFQRFARKDAKLARITIPTLVRMQKMNDSEQQQLKEFIAWQLMGDVTPEQAKWRDETIRDSQSTKLLERRARLALRDGDYTSLDGWLALLPKTVLQNDEWQYWSAIILLNQGKTTEGNAILRNLTKHRGFYPMVAAQKLHITYPLNINKAKRPDMTIAGMPEIKRIQELLYWDMESLARSEWVRLVASQNPLTQEQLARYAFEQHWPSLSVQATITGKMWDHLEERFPLAWKNEFANFTADKNISQSYAMAIARQESAWDPQARSSKGASGLMQIMPKTAEHTVKTNKIQGYASKNQLMNPIMNIKIGTAYLDSVYQRFDNNRILASAAYNAGPTNVDRWLADTSGHLDPIAFIESIPFNETRNYVKNVLAYDMFYHNFMGKISNVLTDTEWQRHY